MIVTFSSCDEHSEVENIDAVLSEERYEKIRQSVLSDLSYILIENGEFVSNLGSRNIIAERASRIYTKEDYAVFNSSYTNINFTRSLSPKLKSKITDINDLVATAKSPESAILNIGSYSQSILNSDMNIQDKDFVLTYIASYQASIEFLYQYSYLVEYSPALNKTEGWWEDWGKCAAGVTGEAILGGATVGLGAAAVASVVPVIGTATAGVVGGIVGVIGGGLKGAADYC